MGTTAYGVKGQGKGKGSREGRLGQGGRGRSEGGERPMGTTAYGGKGSKGRAVNGDRPAGATSYRREEHHGVMPNPPNLRETHREAAEKGEKTFLAELLSSSVWTGVLLRKLTAAPNNNTLSFPMLCFCRCSP